MGDARYQNYKNSKGKYIVSLDSDQQMDPNLIEVCVDFCENENFDALIISEKSIPKANSGFLEKLLTYDKWVIDQCKDSDVVFGTACPRFFKKDSLKGIKWPKHLGIFDDTILYTQLIAKKSKVKYVSSSSIRHSEMTSWWILMRKFHRYGKSYPIAFKQNPATIAGHSLPRRAYFSGVAFSKPNYFLGLILLYTVKAVSASSGVAAYFIEKGFSSKKSNL